MINVCKWTKLISDTYVAIGIVEPAVAVSDKVDAGVENEDGSPACLRRTR